MRLRTRFLFAVPALLCTVGAWTMSAQTTSSPAPSPAAAAQARPDPVPVSLKVTVTLSRMQGTKVTARLPFEMWVNTGRGGSASLRMGSDVPMATTTFGKEGENPTTSYSYRTVGTSIDCSADEVSPGMFKISVSVEDSQVFQTPGADARQQSIAPRPVIQSFRSTTNPILRDGQTAQHMVATDKVSGETIHLELSLAVVK